MANELTTVRQILKRNRNKLLKRSNVVAAGVGYKIIGGQKTTTLGIICSVIKKVTASQLSSRDMVPATLEGTPTDVVQTGIIRALQSPTNKYRPAPGGVSIGHRDITAGTLGCLIQKDGQKFILSNNHVLANSNQAEIGDPILQPGPYDGGTYPDDHIADLEDFIPINFIGLPSECPIATGTANLLNKIAQLLGSHVKMKAINHQALENLVDAAIARPLKQEDVSDEILQIGTIQGTAIGELGMAIKKSGRTTGLTTGVIEQVDVSVNVQYGQDQIAMFTDQLMAGAMSKGGDSGSAVLDGNNRLVGLLFAGSDTTTVINRIENVFSALGVSV
jgi:S1-C subfamily serine protease